jgi:hypothetical protein
MVAEHLTTGESRRPVIVVAPPASVSMREPEGGET